MKNSQSSNGTAPSQQASQSDPYRRQDDDISLADLFKTLISRKWYVLIGYTVVLAAVSIYTYKQDPVYEASSLIVINNVISTTQLD